MSRTSDIPPSVEHKEAVGALIARINELTDAASVHVALDALINAYVQKAARSGVLHQAGQILMEHGAHIVLGPILAPSVSLGVAAGQPVH